MRYLAVLAVMGLSSSMAMADFQVFEGPSTSSEREKTLQCHFRGDKGLHCNVEVKLEGLPQRPRSVV